jgi:predicted acetyltransferase
MTVKPEDDMEIRALIADDIPAAKQLWMDAFGDSEAFVRFYFENKFDPGRSLGAFDAGRMAGDLTMQDMTVRMRGARMKTGFLAGCATRPEYRNRGVMRELLRAQMARMNEDGYALCHLHPFLHAFYRKFGWETVSFMREGTVRPAAPASPPRENVFDPGELWRLYRAFAGRADGCFERSRRDMEIRVGEHMNDGGKVVAQKGGYALYFVSEREVEVIELVWTEAPPGAVIAPLGAYGRPVRFFVPDFDDGGMKGGRVEYTMMRIVNAKRLLLSLRLGDVSFTLRVRDDFCGWNDITLAVDCRGGYTRVREAAGAGADADADIRDLARLAAGKTEGISGPLSKIFTCQKTCFFNTY